MYNELVPLKLLNSSLFTLHSSFFTLFFVNASASQA